MFCLHRVAERGLEPPTLVVYLIVVAVWSSFAFYIVQPVALRWEFGKEGESAQKREQGSGLVGVNKKDGQSSREDLSLGWHVVGYEVGRGFVPTRSPVASMLSY